jgi:hypothetical protein
VLYLGLITLQISVFINIFITNVSTLNLIPEICFIFANINLMFLNIFGSIIKKDYNTLNFQKIYCSILPINRRNYKIHCRVYYFIIKKFNF